MANIWPACGCTEYAVVWITKVWQILYSVLIWLSLLALSFFGTTSPTGSPKPLRETGYGRGVPCRLSVLFSTSLCLCAVEEGSHSVWRHFTSSSPPCVWHAPLCKPLQLHGALLFESLVLQHTYRSLLFADLFGYVMGWGASSWGFFTHIAFSTVAPLHSNVPGQISMNNLQLHSRFLHLNQIF